jgi:hypothetical protein
MLGGTATLSTHKDGKATRRLLFNVYAQGLALSAPFFTVGAFLAMVVRLQAAITSRVPASFNMILLVIFGAGAVAFAAPVLWGLRPETVEMRRDILRVKTGNRITEIPWASVRELRATAEASYVSLRLVINRGAVIVRSDTVSYTMKWWRFPIEDQKRFFIFAATMVLPAGASVVDDLRWLPPDKASNPAVSSKWERQYGLAIKAGEWMAVIGLFFSVGLWVGVPLLGAVGLAMLFIGIFAAVVAWAALDEDRKKRDRI